MSGIIRIDIPKGVEEGSTSLSPQSPKVSATASPTVSRKNVVLLGYGAMVAKSVYSSALQEIRAGGNEELATTISNITTGVGLFSAALYTGGLSLIPQGISVAASSFAKIKSNQRINRAREYERSMRGNRVSYNQGGGYE
jgi:hypothetical protein